MQSADAPTGQYIKLVRWVYQFILLCTLLWLSFNFLLAPVWGEHIYDISEHILKRKDYLDSKGIFTSPSLQFFKDISYSASWGAGSIYGFFLMNLPLALILSFFENIVSYINRKKLRLLVRGCSWLIFLLIFSSPILTFSSIGMFLYALLILFALPIILKKFIGGVHFYAKITNKTKSKVICGVLIILIVLPTITHPVWDIMYVNPEKYQQEINPTTLFRDWLLLDEHGESKINSWYYDNTIFASESEKVTVFQPLVVGYVELDINYWQRIFSSYFLNPNQKGLKGQPITFVKQTTTKEALEQLKQDNIDYIAISSDLINDSKSALANVDQNQYGYFSHQKKQIPEIQNLYHLNNFFGKKQIWSYRQISSTPFTRIAQIVRTKGYHEPRNKVVAKHRNFLGYLMNSSSFQSVFMLAVILCLGYFSFTLLSLLFQILPWLFYIGILLLALPIYQKLAHNAQFWSERKLSLVETKSIENKIFQFHKLANDPKNEDLDKLLNLDLSSDKRIAMWQVNILGNAYPKSNSFYRTEILKWLLANNPNYSTWPLNLRYKFIEAACKIPQMHAYVEVHLKEEKHLYIRWYGENYGFGRDSLSGF